MSSSRSGSQGSPASSPPPTIEAVRRRARHRLIGASVLVAAGVIGFPLLFDSQPRPIAVDIPIDIPARNSPPPVASASAPAPAPAPTRPPAPAPEPPTPPAASPAPSPAPTPAPPPPAPAPAPSPAPSPAPAPAPARTADAARAEAILQGKPPASSAPAAERLVVQVGAYADDARAREARQKLESAGLKTYTHVAQTAEGRRIRVRIGPFDSRAEADKAAARVKSLGLPAAVLTL